MTEPGLSYKYEYSAGKPTILFIHGFMGSGDDWQDIIKKLDGKYSVLTIDLPGHGKSLIEKEEYFSFHYVNKSINTILDFLQIDKIYICGYSMGGRVALNYATRYPERVKKLILESSTAGISGIKEKKERQKLDELMAEKLENIPYSKFLVEWYQLPLFSSLRDNHRHYDIIASKKGNNPKQLSISMRKMGTGNMESMWFKLSYLSMPTCIIHGEYDTKYSDISQKMQELIPNCTVHKIKNAGHVPHIENTQAFLNILQKFLLAR